jgi:parallel beta-helix repeat protein
LTKLRSQKKIAVTLFTTLLFLSLAINLQSVKPSVLGSKSVVYVLGQTYEYHEAIEINGDDDLVSQAAVEGWLGSGTPSYPIIISGYFFNATHVQPIRLWNLELSWELRNNYLTTYGVICGIWLQNCVGGVVADNIIVEAHGGIIIDGKGYLVQNNTISNNTGNGIEVYGTADDIIIRNNTIQGVGLDGITLPATTNSIVANNTLLNNNMNGIKIAVDSHYNEFHGNDIRYNRYGISCRGNYNIIEENDIGYNDKGISISTTAGGGNPSSHNNITKNNILDNIGMALDIRPLGTSNKITDNNFINNGDEFQIQDNGTDNEFECNYYNEWYTPDADTDGFVDEPYSIEGSANSVDEFPRADLAIPLPDWYLHEPLTPTTILTDTTTSGPPPSLPMMEIALVLGGVLIIIVVILIRKRG